jgi:dTMP kinase
MTPSRLTELAQLEYSLYHHKQSYPGKLVVIEGPDGVGKSTVCSLLPRHFIKTRQPTNSHNLGQWIRHWLNDSTVPVTPMMFAGDRAHHLRTVILPTLWLARTVVCDRYTLSSIVYQSFNPDGSPNPERAQEARRLNEIFYSPDLTVILTCDIEVSMERIKSRSTARQAMENEPFQRSVHAAYSSVQPTDKTIVIDTQTNTPEQIVRMVMERL